MSEHDWTHDGLAEDLTRNRWDSGYLAGHEVSLGPKDGIAMGSAGQADVATVRPSFTNAQPTIFEVKVSRSDFLSDTRSGKWERYRRFCDKLYFATPRNLVDKREIPDGCGLFFRNENGWYSVQAPRVDRAGEDRHTLVRAILLNLMPTPWDTPHPDRYQRVRWLAENRRTRKVLGEELAEDLSDLKRLRRRQERVDKAQKALRDALNAPWGSIDRLAEKAVDRLNGKGITQQYNATIEVVQEAMPLDHAFDPMSLAAHVGNIIRERDRLRDRVEELQGEDAA